MFYHVRLSATYWVVLFVYFVFIFMFFVFYTVFNHRFKSYFSKLIFQDIFYSYFISHTWGYVINIPDLETSLLNCIYLKTHSRFILSKFKNRNNFVITLSKFKKWNSHVSSNANFHRNLVGLQAIAKCRTILDISHNLLML